jgi:hypothetical protein
LRLFNASLPNVAAERQRWVENRNRCAVQTWRRADTNLNQTLVLLPLRHDKLNSL